MSCVLSSPCRVDRFRILVFSFASASLLVLFGCSGSGSESEVSGQVTLDGKAIGPGDIIFAPENSQENPAIGTIQSDGSYSLKTGGMEGLPAGKYRVAVVVYEPGPKLAPGERSSEMPDLVTPEKLGDVSTSGLEYEVKPGSNTIDIALESD